MNDKPIPLPAAAEGKPSSVSNTNVRQDPRLPLEFPVVVRYKQPSGETVRLNCKTVSVSVNGALLACPNAIDIGQSLLLTNVNTAEEVECSVRHLEQKEKVNHVGIAFGAWVPEFWEITFPRREGDPPPNHDAVNAGAQKLLLPGRGGSSVKNSASDEIAKLSLKGPIELSSESARPRRKALLSKKMLMIASGIAIAIIALWIFVAMGPGGQDLSSGGDERTAGLPSEVALLIKDGAGLRLAAAEDFAPQAASWLQSLGQQPGGRISGDFAGSGDSRAYILLGNDMLWRVAVVADGQLLCDAQYQAVAIAARVPKEIVPAITWAEAPPTRLERDGLLIVRSAQQPSSSVVLFLRGNDVVSGRPVDYDQIRALQVPEGSER